MKFFPISIDTSEKTILVLGGGSVATNKIKTLLDSEFKIYCISDDFTEELLNLKEENPERLLLKGRAVTEDFVFFGYDYCVLATGDSKLNKSLAARARRSKIPFYRADNIGDSTFRFNDIVEQGGLSVSVLSEGISNPVMKQITTDIENVLFKYDIEKLKLLNEIRSTLVLRNHPSVDDEIERLSKQNVAVIKSYQETLSRTKPDIVEEFINDGKADEFEKEKEKQEKKEESKVTNEENSKE